MKKINSESFTRLVGFACFTGILLILAYLGLFAFLSRGMV